MAWRIDETELTPEEVAALDRWDERINTCRPSSRVVLALGSASEAIGKLAHELRHHRPIDERDCRQHNE